MSDPEQTGKHRWGCGHCGREFRSNDRRETTCPECGGYLFNPDGKKPITDGGTDSILYLITARCFACGEAVDHIERLDQPVNLTQDVGVSADYCPNCGEEVFDWDVHEEARVERAPPIEEVNPDV